MTKDEIIEKIKYKGKYTKEVKKRLNALIKKYHPDRNKNDKETILILYDVKEELENGTIKYIDNSNNNSSINNINKEDSSKSFFLEKILEELKQKKNEINKKINSLYETINNLTRNKNKQQEKIYDEKTKIVNLEEELEDLKGIDILDIIFILLIIVQLLGFFIFKSIWLLLIGIGILLLEIHFIKLRYIDYNNKMRELKKALKREKKEMNQYETMEDEMNKLQKEEFKLKKERSKINNDIQFYSHEFSKIKGKEQYKENTNTKSDENVYKKYK